VRAVAKVLAFDVNETLLDLAALDDPFTRAFGSAAQRPLWSPLGRQPEIVGPDLVTVADRIMAVDG